LQGCHKILTTFSKICTSFYFSRSTCFVLL